MLVSQPDAAQFFAGLACVVMDEVHALAGTKRGDQLALCVARLAQLAPQARRVGLSATVAHKQAILDFVGSGAPVHLVEASEGTPPDLRIMLAEENVPWAGRMGIASAALILDRIRTAGLTIVFVNTRAQGEMLFQALWKLNEETLPIALHHGSLDIAQRRRVEAAMARGALRAVGGETSSLDLGIDWGGVDQVIQLGAPKGVSRLLQRVGRANHRMDEASRAILVPANRFEVLECTAAVQGVAARELDGDAPRPGGLDVLAQHILLMAAAAPFLPDELFAEIRAAAPYAGLTRQTFGDVLRFVEDGGYALSAYERYRKLFRGADDRVQVRSDRIARAGAHEYRHHRRGAAAEGPPPGRTRRRRAGRDRGKLRQHAAPRRHLHVRWPVAALRPRAGNDGGLRGRRQRGPDGTRLCRRPAAAQHQPGRPGAGHAARPGDLARLSGRGAGMAGAAAGPLRAAAPGRVAGRGLPAPGAAGSWSPIASKAATPTRPSACC